jgi:DNA polymerase-4
MAVGGESRGIIASASYEARKFGIYTPMPTARARKLCPKLIVLPGDYERYEQFSNWMFGYAYDFTPDVEQTSIDEGYFDLTANHQKPAVEIARTIRRAIGQSLKITISEGIGSNKLVSQIASKLHKPAAFQNVPDGHEKQFLHPLPNKWLPGVGPKTAVRLNAAGLADIGQIAAMPVELLSLLLGQQAPGLRQFANGIDERPLIPASEPQKTFSQQETFNEDVTDDEYVEAVLRRMADRLFATVREEGRSVRTLTVKVRYNDRDENQRAASLREPTDLETDVYGRLRGLLNEAWQRRVSLRMVSLKLSNVYDGVFRSELPLEAEAKNHEARERLAAVMDELRRDKGWSVILRGHDLRLRDAPRDIVKERAPSARSAPEDAAPCTDLFERSDQSGSGTPLAKRMKQAVGLPEIKRPDERVQPRRRRIRPQQRRVRPRRVFDANGVSHTSPGQRPGFIGQQRIPSAESAIHRVEGLESTESIEKFGSFFAHESCCARGRAHSGAAPPPGHPRGRPRSVARPQLLHVSRFDAFAHRHRGPRQTTRPAGHRHDRPRQFARRGRVRPGRETRGHQADFRNGIARERPPAAALRRIRARLSQLESPALAESGSGRRK